MMKLSSRTNPHPLYPLSLHILYRINVTAAKPTVWGTDKAISLRILYRINVTAAQHITYNFSLFQLAPNASAASPAQSVSQIGFCSPGAMICDRFPLIAHLVKLRLS